MRWIKIHNSLLDWEWYSDGNMVRLWLHLLLKANYKDKKWMGQVVKRGQLVTGRDALSKELGISVQVIRTCMKRLVSTNEITIKPTNKYSIITICRYDEYQACESTTNQQSTSKQPSCNQQATTPIEYDNYRIKNITEKERKERKEKENFIDSEFEEAFSMWLEYKRQRGEPYKSELSLKQCYKKLLKLSDNSADAAMAIVEQSISNNWAGLFALKKQYHENHQTNIREQYRDERTKGFLKTIARLTEENNGGSAELRRHEDIPW